uniref:Uncharacterized protein n=1 Tax=Picea sitchensis TaxID=3332 RepID=D5ACQ1_PICSI|nr:unknown [Picea sitchensis]
MSLPSETVNDLQDEDSNAALLIDADRDLICKRKVQWNDRNGKDLTSVWKFQPSESDSDSEEEEEHCQSCGCVIM